ncbi:hypothetical protein [Hymenobacter terrenus]|uniref:hypothetical protein n=1 Tax=Hymenobacter terrenus TaxID=1629124 RepID=UPI000619F22F|nr:hypothetical protein [Hymenobacter terrenus]
MDEFLQLVLARLDQVPDLRDTTRIWNNQLRRLNEEQQFLYPVCFIEPTNVRYVDLSGGNQEVTLTLTVHVVNESPFQGTELDIYTLKNQVNRYLYQFTASGNCTPFIRTSELLDLDHDNLYDYQISYTTLFREYVEPLDEQVARLGAYQIGFDLDVEDQVIRSGDNRGYVFPVGTVMTMDEGDIPA